MTKVWLAAVGLLLVGLAVLAAPGDTLGSDCGSPVAPTSPSAAQAWNDVYAIQSQVRDCPTLLRGRSLAGGAAVVGAVAVAAQPSLASRRGTRRTAAALTAVACGLLAVAVLLVVTASHSRLRACGTAVSPFEAGDDCDAQLLRRWLGSGAAAGGALVSGVLGLFSSWRSDRRR